LVQRCKHPRRKKPPDIGEIHKALALLQQLGLVEAAGQDGFRLLRNRFDIPAELAWQQLAEPAAPEEPAPVRRAKAQDPERTGVALELVEAGNFDLAIHFDDIFRDLGYVRDPRELALLAQKVHKHRNKPLTPDKWENCWRQYQRELKGNSRSLTSEKVRLDLSRAARREVELALPATAAVKLIWAKLVLWLNGPGGMFYAPAYTLHVQLVLADEIIWQRRLTEEDEIVRRELSAHLKQHPQAICRLSVETDEPLRRVSIAAQLEAAVWRE
jgi:hypothetical protein